MERDSDWTFHLVNSNNDEAGNLAVDVQRSYEEIMKHEEEKNSLKASLEAYIEALTVHSSYRCSTLRGLVVYFIDSQD